MTRLNGSRRVGDGGSKGTQPLWAKESHYLSPQSKERKISGGLCRGVSVNTFRWLRSCLNARRGELDTSALGSEYYTAGKCRRLCGLPLLAASYLHIRQEDQSGDAVFVLVLLYGSVGRVCK